MTRPWFEDERVIEAAHIAWEEVAGTWCHKQPIQAALAAAVAAIPADELVDAAARALVSPSPAHRDFARNREEEKRPFYTAPIVGVAETWLAKAVLRALGFPDVDAPAALPRSGADPTPTGGAK